MGWAVGEHGTIISTIDGGQSWNYQSSMTRDPINIVTFIDENIGYVAGAWGTILKTTNGGITFVEEEEINEMPTDFTLSQNYPNPFNPSTKIQYSLPQSSNVIIKIYDILGNEIETLIKEEQPAGTYEVTWNAANLPSGIYFYHIKTRYFIETKKMILLK